MDEPGKELGVAALPVTLTVKFAVAVALALSVTVSVKVELVAVQLGLFDPPAERAEALARLKREVNARCGRFALRSGATLFVNEFYKDEAYAYEVCDVRGKLCF